MFSKLFTLSHALHDVCWRCSYQLISVRPPPFASKYTSDDFRSGDNSCVSFGEGVIRALIPPPHPAFSLCAFPSYLPTTAILVLLARWKCRFPSPLLTLLVFLRLTRGGVGADSLDVSALSLLTFVSFASQGLHEGRSPRGKDSPQNLPPLVARIWGSVWRRLLQGAP